MKYFTLYIAILVSSFCSAQTILQGKILDAETQEPVEMVSIIIEKSFIGTSSNEAGEFTLKYENLNESQQIIFQRLGYSGDTILLKELRSSKIILLRPNAELLEEIKIYPIDPFKLLQQAIEKIPDNYYSNPITHNGFYRQYLIGNNELVGLEEAKFSLINTFNESKPKNNVSIAKARGFIDLTELKDLGKVLANNLEDDSVLIAENAALLIEFNPNLEMLREDSKSIFGEKGDKVYEYKYNGFVPKNGNICYYISFDQKENVKKTLFRGNLYIDTSSLAFVEVEVELSPQGIDFQKLVPLKFRMLAKLMGFTINISNLKFSGQYGKHNDFWIVNSGDYSLSGSISRRSGASFEGTFRADYWVEENLPKEKYYNVRSSFERIESDVKPFLETNFWEGENFPKAPAKVINLLKDLLEN